MGYRKGEPSQTVLDAQFRIKPASQSFLEAASGPSVEAHANALIKAFDVYSAEDKVTKKPSTNLSHFVDEKHGGLCRSRRKLKMPSVGRAGAVRESVVV